MKSKKQIKKNLEHYFPREINMPKYEYQKPEYGFGSAGGSLESNPIERDSEKFKKGK